MPYEGNLMRRLVVATVATAACLTLTMTPVDAGIAQIVIDFEDIPTGDDGVALGDQYDALGVSFVTDNGLVWGGNSNGDPGGWDLEGPAGPRFLGFNGDSYGATIELDEPAASLSFQAARSNGSSDGDSLNLTAYCGAEEVDADSVVFGPVNSWSTLSVAADCIDSVQFAGVGEEFHPYGIDDVRIRSGETPPPSEPTTSTTQAVDDTVAITVSRATPVAPRFTG
jgi:hypothetical protein